MRALFLSAWYIPFLTGRLSQPETQASCLEVRISGSNTIGKWEIWGNDYKMIPEFDPTRQSDGISRRLQFTSDCDFFWSPGNVNVLKASMSLLVVCEISISSTVTKFLLELIIYARIGLQWWPSFLLLIISSNNIYFQYRWPYSKSLSSFSYKKLLWIITDSAFCLTRFNTLQMNRGIWELLRIILPHEKLQGVFWQAKISIS